MNYLKNRANSQLSSRITDARKVMKSPSRLHTGSNDGNRILYQSNGSNTRDLRNRSNSPSYCNDVNNHQMLNTNSNSQNSLKQSHQINSSSSQIASIFKQKKPKNSINYSGNADNTTANTSLISKSINSSSINGMLNHNTSKINTPRQLVTSHSSLNHSQTKCSNQIKTKQQNIELSR